MKGYYVHKQETWTEAKCERIARKVHRDGLGTASGIRGLVASDSSPYPSYGQTRAYNGGCIRDGEHYAGETVPLPAIPESFEFYSIPSWGIALRKKGAK